MRKVVRYSAGALVAALGVGAAYAAWPSVGHFAVALRHTPIIAWIDDAPVEAPAALPAGGQAAVDNEAFAEYDSGSAHCLVGGCAAGPAIKPTDACQPCFGNADPSLTDFVRSGLDEAAPTYAETGFNLDGLGLSGDLSSVYLAGFEPVATAAPAPEISTAAMLTLGFAALVRAARRARRDRPALRPTRCQAPAEPNAVRPPKHVASWRNRGYRPVADLPDHPGTGGERGKVLLGVRAGSASKRHFGSPGGWVRAQFGGAISSARSKTPVIVTLFG
jgi:hypothetical protein